MGRVEKDAYPIAYAIIDTGGQIGAVTMPLVGGDIYDWSASWRSASRWA